MSKRRYEDRKLKKYFEKYVKRMPIDKQYKPMLVDILMRRADAFDLSNDEITQDMTSLLYNLDSISVLREMPAGYEGVYGLYNPPEHEVLVSEDVMRAGDKVAAYQTITHEVYHALSRDEDGNDRLAGYNMFTRQYNSSLLEAIIEKSSYRAVFGNDKQNNIYYNNSARGYADVTFIVDVLEATYGVSEKEFLSRGIMGREKLSEFLAERSGETPDSAYAFLDSIEANYALLHGALYPLTGQEPTPYERNGNVECALAGIYNLCESKMAERIGRTQVSSFEDVTQLNDELKYDHNKLSAIMADRLGYFSQCLGTNLTNNVMWRVQDSRNNTLIRINNINDLVEAAPNFGDEVNFMNAYSWASTGELSRLPQNILTNFGINLRFQETMPISDEIVEAAFYDEDFGPQYDNSKIPKIIKKINRNNILKRGIDKVKNFLTRGNQKLLTEGTGAQIAPQVEEQESDTIFPKLTKEEQQRYNEQVRMAVESLGRNQTTEEIDRDIEEK